MCRMPDIYIPTEGYPYISSAEAQWLAIDSLFIARSRNLVFEDVFMGGLSKYYQAWAMSEIENGRNGAAASQLKALVATEHLRAVFDDPKNSIWLVVENDVQPLRMVIEGVMSGGSQKAVMERVCAALTKPDGIRDEFLKDPEFAESFPRLLNHTSTQRLGQLWAKYNDIFHYVLLWHVGFLSVRSGQDLEVLPDPQELHKFIKARILSASTTKKLRLRKVLLLTDVSSASYDVTDAILDKEVFPARLTCKKCLTS